MAERPRRPMFQPGPIGYPNWAVNPAYSNWSMGSTSAPPGYNPAAAFAGGPPRMLAPTQPQANAGNNWLQQLGGLGRGMLQGLTTPFSWYGQEALRPQGRNEEDIVYQLRRGWTAPSWLIVDEAKEAARGLGKVGGAIAGEARALANWATQTPASREEAEFRILVGQESNGKQFDKNGRPLTSPKGAIGVAQVMPGTGPEAARLAGLPWDERRYKTDANYNYQLGLAYYRAQRAKFGDPALAAAAYNAGPGRAAQAQRQAAATGKPVSNFLPQETRNYMSNFMNSMGRMASTFGAPPPAFDPSAYQGAMANIDAAAQLQSTPYSATFTEPDIPDRPAPEAFQAPDFSAGDAAFQATMPKNPFDDPKARRSMEKDFFFKGIGQAMASLSGGEGIGTMLMKIGAGSLMGKAAAGEAIRQREDEFDQRMAEYNRALASREDSKAATLANVLNKNIEQRNAYAEQIWSDNVSKIKRPTVSGNNLITYVQDKDDPQKYTMTVTPLGFGPQAEALVQKANIGIRMADAALGQNNFAYQSQQTAARTALGLTTQMALTQENNPQAAAEGYMTEAASLVRSTIRAGSWKGYFGTPGLSDALEAQAKADAYAAVGVQLNPKTGLPLMPMNGQQSQQFADIFEDNLTNRVFETIATAGNLDKLFTNERSRIARATQRSGSARESVRTDSRGRTTVTRAFSMDE